MAELLPRLQGALGDAYRLERELGGGGMSRVFLAEETALGRKVVVKVLPPELSAGLNIDRFRREIQLAANLQHPHIVPLLAAGHADGLLYYTMPLVEGESLRARLLRESELPIGEAVRLLRDVADALVCAHEHGVVHRDIKPDNVLVSRHHALVTDFGVAKALSDSTGGFSFTSVGVALGTPAYMAPEQASADPHADYRVDIYAVGVLAYEMLTGRPPFTGTSPQALLVAQVTQAPAPITDFRPTVPSGLAGLVMRCIEKKPADRWQSADELLHHLEAMATPSGGTQPVMADGSRPSPRGSVAPTGPPAASLPTHVLRSWRAALFAAALVVALGAVYLSWAGRPSGGSESEGVDAKMLAILPFKNLGSAEDQYFTDGLTEEITSRLAGVQGLGIISRTSADQYRGTTKTIREIGRELRVGYVLEGSVRWEKRGTSPSRIRVTPQLIRVSDDRHLWADRYDADLADIFQVQGSIAERVTDALNVALGGSERAALGAQPTSIPAAYDYYLRGLEYERNRGNDGIRLAVEMYQKAVTLDPGFALGFARLAKVHALLYWFYQDRSDARLALSKQAADSALRLSPTLPEGHIAMGLYHYWGHLNYEAALNEFSIAQAQRPNDSELLYATGLVQRRQGRWREAMASLGRASELSPRALDINSEFAGTAFVTRDWPAVEQIINRLLAFHPDQIDGYHLKAFLAILAHGDTAAASAALRDGLARSDSAQLLATYPAYLLERDPALRPAFDRVSVATFFGDSGTYYSWRAWLKRRTGERPSEQVYWDSLRAFAERRTAARPSDATYHTLLGTAYAGLGHKSEAIREGRKGLQLVPPSRDALEHFIRVWELARILVMVGDHEAVIDQIEYLTTIPTWFTRNGWRYYPEWEPLRSNPRFQRVVAAMK